MLLLLKEALSIGEEERSLFIGVVYKLLSLFILALGFWAKVEGQRYWNFYLFDIIVNSVKEMYFVLVPFENKKKWWVLTKKLKKVKQKLQKHLYF